MHSPGGDGDDDVWERVDLGASSITAEGHLELNVRTKKTRWVPHTSNQTTVEPIPESAKPTKEPVSRPKKRAKKPAKKCAPCNTHAELEPPTARPKRSTAGKGGKAAQYEKENRHGEGPQMGSSRRK